MKPRIMFAFTICIFVFLAVTGCSTLQSSHEQSRRKGESVVLIGEIPARLAFVPISPKYLQVRSTYLPGLPETVVYDEGIDFVVDYERGEIRRTASSRIPDFRTNMLFGVEDFDHSKFPGFGNSKFFAFIDYRSKAKIDWPHQSTQTQFLPKTAAKLQRGDNVKIVAFGDSITAGGDATKPDLVFWKRWSDYLQHKYVKAKVTAVNGATGGDSTVQGLARLSEKVLKENPDVVLLGFGMNDHNIAGFGVSLPSFTNNLATIIDRIRKETGAEVILYSAFPPNPKWHYGSHNMEAYARATERVARDKNCAFADVYTNWVTLCSKKKPEDVLANNINHPNDFGHDIYFQVLKHLGL